MSEEFGNDFIVMEDEDGQEFELEVIDTMDYNGKTYTAFLPTDISEDDPDFGFIILQNVVENGEELFNSVDDEDELNDVYEHFLNILYEDSEEEE